MPSRWLRDLQAKHHAEHMERVRKMRPVVDAGPPRELPLSGKKEIERKRFHDKVERGNRALLDRLGKAMEHKHIDNERHDKIKFQSLQAGLKKVELARVTMENQLLLHRIQSAIPAYDHNEWEREAEGREFYLKNMTQYPELYVPHYPPLRKKFLEEQQQAKAAAGGGTKSPDKHGHSGGGGMRSGSNSALIKPPSDEAPSLERPRAVARIHGREGMEGVTGEFIYI